MSIKADVVLTEEEPLMISFQIPSGDFVCLRAIIRSTQKTDGPEDGPVIVHGLAFSNVEFAIKRQIRSYVSSRSI